MAHPIQAKPSAFQDEARYFALTEIIVWLNALPSSSVDATTEAQRQRALKERQEIQARKAAPRSMAYFTQTIELMRDQLQEIRRSISDSQRALTETRVAMVMADNALAGRMPDAHD